MSEERNQEQESILSESVRVSPLVQVHIDEEERIFPFSDLVPPGGNQDPATVSDSELLEMVARWMDREIGDFGRHKVTRPETGNILISEAAVFGENVFIGDLEKADVLAALYNASRPQGLGFLHYDNAPMTPEEAQKILEKQTYFDYFKGRVMKVDLANKQFDPFGYDRHNGQGTARRVVESLRNGATPDSEITASIHEDGKKKAADDVVVEMQQQTTTENRDGFVVITSGLTEFADELGEALANAFQNDNEE